MIAYLDHAALADDISLVLDPAAYEDAEVAGAKDRLGQFVSEVLELEDD